MMAITDSYSPLFATRQLVDNRVKEFNPQRNCFGEFRDHRASLFKNRSLRQRQIRHAKEIGTPHLGVLA
jgi:diphthamide synthase subunit DPH2